MGDPTNKVYTCPMELSVDLLTGKWKPQVLWYLKEGVQCFGQLSRHMPLVKPRRLAEILRELEREGLVEQLRHSEVPLSIDYVITDTGRALGPLLDLLDTFGERYASERGVELLQGAAIPPAEDDLPLQASG